MALFSVPFTTIYLVSHASGGAILHSSGGFIGGTFITAQVVSAFTNATSTLSLAASAIGAIATSPVAIGVAVTAAAVGGYFYFFGIPAQIELALAQAGYAAPSSGGLAVPIAKLGIALVVLGLAGLLVVNIYKRIKQARLARPEPISIENAQFAAESVFGVTGWKSYGAAIWTGASDTASQISGWIESSASSARKVGATAILYADISRRKIKFSFDRFRRKTENYSG